MKRILIAFAIAIFAVNTFAQTSRDERRIKTDLRKVDRYVASLKKLEGKEPSGRSKLVLRRALETIAAFKKKHPGYDIAERENYVAGHFKRPTTRHLGSQNATAEKCRYLSTKLIRELLEFDVDYLGPITNAEQIAAAESEI